jgi:hypothetical protein
MTGTASADGSVLPCVGPLPSGSGADPFSVSMSHRSVTRARVRLSRLGVTDFRPRGTLPFGPDLPWVG